MSSLPRDLTPLPDLLHGHSRSGPVRENRPVYVDLLPPCNAGCPAGEDIQAWLAHAQAGEHELAWRALTADNPFAAIHGRVCYHPCESVCNRASLDSAVSIHAVERFLGDLALERGWQFDPPSVSTGQRVLVIGAGPSGLSAAYRVAVLDRTKEPGSLGEPLFLDVLAALSESHADGERTVMPSVIGGRYGLSSKEFTPAMVAGVFEELERERPKRRFTIGITDDVSGTSLSYDASLDIEPADTVRAVFFGLGSDGTVGANKNTIKILGSEEGLNAQGYFVYDSKKSGSQTVSHLRFGPEPIHAPYLISQASFVGCHQFGLLERAEVLDRAAPGATLLLNCRQPPDEVWDALARPVQEQILAKEIKLYVIDAGKIAREAGLAGRTNTVLQTCFFAISGVLEREQAIERIKASIAKTYGKRGAEVVERNQTALDRSLQDLHRVELPPRVTAEREPAPEVPAHAPEFVRTVTAAMMAGRGDQLPVSALPVDGTYPSGTTQYEKRNISEVVAAWDSELCIQCGNCSFVCPHSVIRSRQYEQARLEGAPDGFRSAPLNAPGVPDARYTLQVYVEDCTGCGLCVEACPVSAAGEPARKAINLEAIEPLLPAERERIAFFEQLPANDRSRVDFGTVRGTQFLEPLFEFSGACAGCGETPYLKLVSQLFGDRLTIANATGCSSIYGGNLPTTPWTVDADGHGPAWSNSLFEDNAEFGLGLRLAADRHTALARRRLAELREVIGGELVDNILGAPQLRESELRDQRARLAELHRRLGELDDAVVADLRSVVDYLLRRSVWIVGGDGWAYDIGSGGLDHVLASGRNVNVLVLDTEMYSNTVGRCRRRRRSAPWRSSPRRVRRCRPRTSRCRRSPTPMCTWPGSRWAPTPSRH